MLPTLIVPELPETPEAYVEVLSSLGLFDTPPLTAEDAERTALYRTEHQREVAQQAFGRYEDYLASLNMRARFSLCDDATVKRAAQIFLKSNQFNLRTVRYSEAEVKERQVYVCQLEDRFGDYGVISALALQRLGADVFIENWVMSCRVFKRGVEHFILNQLVEIARKEGVGRILGEYLPTAKNSVVANLFAELGFASEGSLWILGLESASPLVTYVKLA
jgi:FkbH-like protein